jgi:cobalt/nickel transport protein
LKKLFLLAALLVLLASFFGSTFPDGLDFVSEKLGFSQKGTSSPAPLANYQIPLIGSSPFFSFIAGLIGVVIILIISKTVVYFIRHKN